ncbi:MAG TPA: hypothetical protein PK941_14770 [Paludibacter sp.]|nr:hypothetical protein [Paludibacter sp.]
MYDDTVNEIDHELTSDVVCPYCGETHYYSDFIFGGYRDGITTCNNCGKEFKWVADFNVTFCTEKIEQEVSDV